MQIAISHLTGNPNSCAAALAFAEVGNLAAFHTTIVVPIWLRQLAGSMGFKRGMWERREFPEQVRPSLRTHPLQELLRLACRNSSLLQKCRLVARLGALEQVVQRFDMAVGRAVTKSNGLQAVYAYMDAAEQTFLAARERGIRTVYELPTPYWRFTRNIVDQEARLQPDWAGTLPFMAEDSEWMQRRDRELQLADVVIVPSLLVRESLNLAPPFQAKVHVIPYGCPEPSSATCDFASRLSSPSTAVKTPSPLRVLYVGSLNQGKGLAYLDEAMSGLERQAELTVIGSRSGDFPCAALDRFLAAHRHLSQLSHSAVLAEMRQHDVLVLPTLYEGLALVLLEAMACGLTVITTDHAGLSSIIENGREGYIVPIRNSSAIYERLKQLAVDAGKLQTMQKAAWAWSQAHSWQIYREQLQQIIATQ